jgi:hypothetical protein
MTDAPTGSNSDEWALFLSEWGTAYCAVRIAEAIEAAEQRGYARGIKAAVEKMRRLSGKLDILACEDVLQIADDLSALSPTPPAPAPVTVQEAARAWKAAREAAMKNVTPETFTELSKAESALSRALAEQEGQ